MGRRGSPPWKAKGLIVAGIALSCAAAVCVMSGAPLAMRRSELLGMHGQNELFVSSLTKEIANGKNPASTQLVTSKVRIQDLSKQLHLVVSKYEMARKDPKATVMFGRSCMYLMMSEIRIQSLLKLQPVCSEKAVPGRKQEVRKLLL